MPPAEHAIAGTSRPMPRLLLIVAAALLVARVATGVWEEQRRPEVVEILHWVVPSSAESESRRTHRPILYEFSADWCGPCKTMSRELFSDPEAAARIERMFVPVRVVDRQQEEGRNPPEVERLQRAFKVTGFPTLVATWPGAAHYQSADGYRGRTLTLQWLEGAAMNLRMNPPAAPVDSILPPR